jgi:hypothetical protein
MRERSAAGSAASFAYGVCTPWFVSCTTTSASLSQAISAGSKAVIEERRGFAAALRRTRGKQITEIRDAWLTHDAPMRHES